MIIAYNNDTKLILEYFSGYSQEAFKMLKDKYKHEKVKKFSDDSITLRMVKNPDDTFLGYTFDIVRTKPVVLAERLNEIDSLVLEKRNGVFTYQNNDFYPVVTDIHATKTRLIGVPDAVTIKWKTATLSEDGVSNLYVTFTASQYRAFADAFYDWYVSIWAVGDEHKKNLKLLYNSESDWQAIDEYDITTGWPT